MRRAGIYENEWERKRVDSLLGILGDVLMDKIKEAEDLHLNLEKKEDEKRNLSIEINKLDEKLQKVINSQKPDEVGIREQIYKESSEKYEGVLNNVTEKYETQISRLNEEKNLTLQEVAEKEAKIFSLSEENKKTLNENQNLINEINSLRGTINDLRSFINQKPNKLEETKNTNSLEKKSLEDIKDNYSAEERNFRKSINPKTLHLTDQMDNNYFCMESTMDNNIDYFNNNKKNNMITGGSNMESITDQNFEQNKNDINSAALNLTEKIPGINNQGGDSKFEISEPYFEDEILFEEHKVQANYSRPISTNRNNFAENNNSEPLNFNRLDQKKYKQNNKITINSDDKISEEAKRKHDRDSQTTNSTASVSCMTQISSTDYDTQCLNQENLEAYVKSISVKGFEEDGTKDIQDYEKTKNNVLSETQGEENKQNTDYIQKQYCTELEEKVKKLQNIENQNKKYGRKTEKKNIEIYKENKKMFGKMSEIDKENQDLRTQIKELKKKHKENWATMENDIRKEVSEIWEKRQQTLKDTQRMYMERQKGHENTLNSLTEEMEDLCFILKEVTKENIFIYYEIGQTDNEEISGDFQEKTQKKCDRISKVKIVCENCVKQESTVYEMVKNLENSNQMILNQLQRIKDNEFIIQQNNQKNIAKPGHIRGATMITNSVHTPQTHKEPIKILNSRRQESDTQRYKNNQEEQLSENLNSENNLFNFTLELYSYDETKHILVDILSQVSRSNHLLEFLSNSLEFKMFIQSIMQQ